MGDLIPFNEEEHKRKKQFREMKRLGTEMSEILRAMSQRRENQERYSTAVSMWESLCDQWDKITK